MPPPLISLFNKKDLWFDLTNSWNVFNNNGGDIDGYSRMGEVVVDPDAVGGIISWDALDPTVDPTVDYAKMDSTEDTT